MFDVGVSVCDAFANIYCLRIGGAIIDNDYFVVWIAKLIQALHCVANGGFTIQTADYDRNFWPLDLRRERDSSHCLTGCLQRWFGCSIACCQAKIPVIYVCTAPIPFVGPGKQKSPNTA